MRGGGGGGLGVGGRGPVKKGGDAGRGGGEAGELGEGQRGDENRTRQNNEQGADGGEYGAMNKRVDHQKQFSVLSSQSLALAARYLSELVSKKGFLDSF